ncbi:MAG: RNA polymerase sigma factor [Flavobacteriaceae bacterium]|nr:RNA polymerase sigma factor [Muriicola sp.]NNC62721.1 RNA polymerase sigma factor [Eudoraea sp.]NNK21459.1 RNA polymerase sigma factor [Flavobacteriaceae bacterium]NNL39681.1 RNA polymerase sigma factor [Flavobacteriaceae bacterium]
MKIISLYENEKVTLRKAIKGNRNAQRTLYEKHSPKMLSVCRQYIKDVHFAEDVMISGFVKVFKGLHSFRFEGSFEGWIRRIMVREAISYLRKNQFVVFDSEKIESYTEEVMYHESLLQVEEVQKLIDTLPEGYKMVFVLYAVEGYKHREIAELLQISESTSKSQLFKARQFLQKRISSLEIRKKTKS